MTSKERTEVFYSPESNVFKDATSRSEQGSLLIENEQYLKYEGRVVVNYAQNFGEDFLLTLHGGADVMKETTTIDGYTCLLYTSLPRYTTRVQA